MLKNYLRLPLILFTVCGISSAVVSYAFNAAMPVINAQSHKNVILGYTQVLPQAVNLQALPYKDSVITEIVRSEKDYKTNGYIYTAEPDGYNGKIKLMVGISHPGAVITGVKILQQTETPGLGAKCTEPAFTAQFTGKTLSKPLAVSKNAAKPEEIQAITASTITSRAVVSGINAARSHYFANFHKN